MPDDGAHGAVAAHIALGADGRVAYEGAVYSFGRRGAEQTLVVPRDIDVQVVDRVTLTVKVRGLLVHGHPVEYVCVLVGRGGTGVVHLAAVGRAQQIDVGTQLHVGIVVGETRGGAVGIGDICSAVLIHLVGVPCERLGGGNHVGARFGTRTRKRLEAGCARHVRGSQRSFILFGTHGRPVVACAAGKVGEAAVRAVGTHPTKIAQVDASRRGGAGSQRPVKGGDEPGRLHVGGQLALRRAGARTSSETGIVVGIGTGEGFRYLKSGGSRHGTSVVAGRNHSGVAATDTEQTRGTRT